MKVTIRDTNEVKTLNIVAPDTGIDCTSDFIGNTGALGNGQFEYDVDSDTYLADRDTYEWWQKVIADNQALENRLHELRNAHSHEAVQPVIDNVGNVDLENLAVSVNAELDEAFGRE